jgi:exodeoxyribonuclease-3
VRVANLYVPNGQTIGAEKFVYKLAWLNALRAWLAAELVANANIVVMGDFNIAPADRDVYDPQQWRDKILCSDDERAQLQGIEAIGFADTFRLFDQPDNIFSWWDYRAAAFRRKRGLRIDLILASAAMAERCTTSDVDSEPRKLERPSDHAPVFAVFEPTP